MVEITIYKHLLTIIPALNRAIFYVGNKHSTSDFWVELYDRLYTIRTEINNIKKMVVYRWGKKYLAKKLKK